MSQRQVQLNRDLAAKTHTADILAVVAQSVREFNLVNCGTALQRLAKSQDAHGLFASHRGGGGGPSDSQPNATGHSAVFGALLDAAAALIQQRPQYCESRQLASLLHACGKIGARHQAARMVTEVEAATLLHASKFNPQELSNAIWGAAKLLVDPNRPLVRALLDAAATSLANNAANANQQPQPRVLDWRQQQLVWTAQGLSNVAWSLATFGVGIGARDAAHAVALRAVCAAIEARAAEFNPQEVANTLWAIAKLTAVADDGAGEPPSSAAGGGDARDPKGRKKGQGTKSAAADVTEAATRAAAAALASRITEQWIAAQRFEPQHVANIAWACAKLGLGTGGTGVHPRQSLAGALGSAAAATAPRMNTQELSMAAWAAAAFGSTAGTEAVASAFASKASEATPQQLATAAAAFARLGTLHAGLMDATADAVVALPSPREKSLNPQDVSNLAWAFAKLGCKHKKLFALLADAARCHLKHRQDEHATDAGKHEQSQQHAAVYSPQQLTMLVWAFGMLGMGFKDEKLLTAAMKSTRVQLADFNPRDLTNMAWAMAALGVQASEKPKLVERFGRAARRRLDAFNSQELLKFLGAFERMGGDDPKLAAAVAGQRTLRYAFPALDIGGGGGSVELSSRTPTSYAGTGRARVDDSCNGSGRGNTGVALWEGSFVLAEWLSRQAAPGTSNEVAAALDGAWTGGRETGVTVGVGGISWRGRTGVELGAGLGLPSIVASRLGLEMVATDGDDDVLELLADNLAANTAAPATPARVSRLLWGSHDPLAALGLTSPPDLVLASDVVYGNDPAKWRQLVKTMCDLSGPHTLVIIGNVQRYPVHHPMAETKFFDAATAADFHRREVSAADLHPDFRRTGGGGCVVHVFRRRPESLKRHREEQEAQNRATGKRSGEEEVGGGGELGGVCTAAEGGKEERPPTKKAKSRHKSDKLKTTTRKTIK